MTRILSDRETGSVSAAKPGRASSEEYIKHLREAWRLARQARQTLEQAKRYPAMAESFLILADELRENAMKEIERGGKANLASLRDKRFLASERLWPEPYVCLTASLIGPQWRVDFLSRSKGSRGSF